MIYFSLFEGPVVKLLIGRGRKEYQILRALIPHCSAEFKQHKASETASDLEANPF